MGRINPAVLNEEQKKAKSEELDQVFKTFVEANDSGAAALKEELRKVEATKEKDDFFNLSLPKA
jgi:hypothetical protein